MGEPGQRLHSNGHPAGQGFAHPPPPQQMHQHQQAPYSATGHLPQPRRSSIQSMLNPSSPDPGSYGYYPGPHSQHPPPQHHMQQQQQQQQQQGQHQYAHPMQQPPAGPPQHHHQYHSHPQHTQHPQHPPHQEHYHDDERQYSQQQQQQQQSYPYQPYPQQHHQAPSQSQQQRPQQQHLHQPPHVGHQQQSTQQQIYYPSQPAVPSTQSPSSLSMNAAPYPGSSNALPPISSQSSFRSHGQYSPGAGSSDPTFQTPPSNSLQAPLQTSVLSHHQQPQQRHIHNGGIDPGKQSPVTGAHSHGAISAGAVAGGASLGSAPPRHSSVEPAMDMRLQSPPATSVHSYSRSSLAHTSGRPPSPRTTAPEFTRSRQTSVSVSGHGYHGEYRPHPPEPTVVSGHYDYGHHYPSSYQEPSFPGPQHAAAHLQQQQQQQQKQQKQQHQHQHQQHQQQQQQQQHQQYASQFSHHSTPGYMRPSSHEVDRAHPHGMTAQQHYGHQSYHQQPPSPPLQSQQTILSPPHRGSMPDVHSGGPRLSGSQQQQQQQPDRPHAENDEALVMNFMSELQMQQQSHGRKQPHKPIVHPVVPPPQPPSHHYQQHPQHPQHPQHGQHRQSLHVDHAPLHSAVAQSHPRYAHDDHVGYSHNQDVQPGAYRSQVSASSQSALELARPKTPPGSVPLSMHIGSQGAGDTRQRLAMTSGLGSGPQSPALDAMPSTTKIPQASRKISTPGSQTSLPPPRSLSLMNILNAPETEGNGDTTDTEEERDTAIVLPRPNTMAEEGLYMDEGKPFTSRPEHDRDVNALIYKDRLHEGYHDGQSQKSDTMAEEHRSGQEPVEAVATPTSAPLKPKEVPARPSKEKPAKKAPKEKVTKVKVDKPEKPEKPPKKPKAPPKKKISASAIAAQGMEEAPTPMDIVPAQVPKGNPAQEPQAGNKHPILESAGENEDKIAKRIRVEGRAVDDDGVHGFSTDKVDSVQTMDRGTTSQRSLLVDPVQSSRMDIDESRKISPDDAAQRSNGPSRTKEELSSPAVPAASRHGRASPISLPETRVEIVQSTPVSSQDATSALSPRPGTPTQGSLASRYRAPVNDQPSEATTGSKLTGDGPDSSSALPPPRDTAKGPKDKKGSKKKPTPEVVQADEGSGQKPQKSTGGMHASSELGTDKADAKGSGKPAVNRKKPSSASAPASSLKDRFSRPTEKVGSPKAVLEESKPSDSISTDVKIHSSDAKLDLAKDKLPKEKRVDHMEIMPEVSVKGKLSSHEQPTEQPKDKETARALPSKEEKTEEQSRSKEDGALYCICRTPYDPSRFMIACDQCDDWFHGDCVGVAEKEIDLVDQYYCKRCEEKGQHGSRKNKCGREGCQKSAGRKSKYCSKECGLLLATHRIRESQEKVFGSPHQQDLALKDGDAPSGQQQQQHLQRRRRLTLADLDDRQRLLTLREKMAHVRMVCAVLVEREKQLEICVDRQARQDLGKFMAMGTSSTSPLSSLAQEKENERSATAAEEDEDENVLRSSAGSKSKSKSKGHKASKDKDKEMLCGFDYSLVWDDAEDMCRAERAALTSLTATPNGSRASSVVPSSLGTVVVVPSKQDVDQVPSRVPGQGGDLDSLKSPAVSPQLQAIGVQVCTARRQCDRHTGWQRLKAAELDLEKTLQNKLLRSLKVEVKLVKSRMKRRRNDLSAGILNGTIEH